MLVGGDLGFSSLALVVIVLVFPVIGFVLRRKWRFAAARREEIKRLLVLASEESARAELEATAGYGSTVAYVPQQLQYQCAMCFCPTTTRCARCKAVRYCSGRCQIIHWRQGHKEECRPFTNFDQSNEGERGSSQNGFNQEKYENYGNEFNSVREQHTKPVEEFPKESALSNSDHTKVLQGKDDIEAVCLTDGKETSSIFRFTTHSLYEGRSKSTNPSEASSDASISNSNDFDGSCGLQSSGVSPDKIETSAASMHRPRLPFSEKSSLGISVDNSGKFGQSKHHCNEAQGGSSSSSGWSVDGSNDSLSEPSTPSSGFWEGTLDSRRYRLDGHDDDCAQSSSSESSGDIMTVPRSSLGFSFDLAKDLHPMDQQGSRTKTVSGTAPGINQCIDEASLIKKIPKGDLKSRRSPSLSSETSKLVDVDSCSNFRVPKSREVKSSSSSACAHPDFKVGGHSVTKDAKKVITLPSPSPEKSNNVVTDTSSSSHALKRQGVEYLLGKASDESLSSSTGRDSGPTAKLSKIDDGLHGDATCTSKFPSYSRNAKNGLKTSMLKVVDQIKSAKLPRNNQLVAGSEITGRHTAKGLFPYELFVKLYNWNKVELQPCGLINCGNSCYANAVLQCLAFTPPLTAYLLQGLHSKACEKKGWCFTCEFESLVLKAKGGNSPMSPIKILSQIGNIGSNLGYGREEDAHEFLRYAIDTMQSICLKETGTKTGVLDEETTLIGLTFGGYLRSKIKCMRCGGKSERHERMMDLTVEIDGDICTLEEALWQFTSTEVLDGENKYQCSRCTSFEKAKKKLTIVEAPNVLTIALKRFQSGKFGKLSKPIHFPEILDMAPYMSGTSDKSPIYRLYGVVVHLDYMNASFSGHYVCYVKNIQNKWFKIDDSTVNAVDLDRVLTKGAYLLLYARCSPRAPKLIRNSIVSRDPRKQKNQPFKSIPSSIEPCDNPMADNFNCQNTSVRYYPDHHSFQRNLPILDEDASSDNSSSFFSEAGSCTTESSNRDSTSADDFFDQIFGDLGHNWNSPWRNSTDSDTSSSSSSPSPPYSSHSHLSNSDHYASKYHETSGYQSSCAELAGDSSGVWARQLSRSCKVESSEGKGSDPFSCPDITKQCKKVGSSNSSSSDSCRETDPDRLGRLNPLSHRRSTRGRTD